MSINTRLRKLLDESRSGHVLLPHPDAFHAQPLAHPPPVRARQIARVVALRDIEGTAFMVVLPADEQIDQSILRRVTGRIGVQIEDEPELTRLFPDCEVGAMPPFGNLYHTPMYVDPCLLADVDVYFRAGNHREIVMMRTAEFQKLARPFHVRGCMHRVTAKVERVPVRR